MRDGGELHSTMDEKKTDGVCTCRSSRGRKKETDKINSRGCECAAGDAHGSEMRTGLRSEGISGGWGTGRREGKKVRGRNINNVFLGVF